MKRERFDFMEWLIAAAIVILLLSVLSVQLAPAWAERKDKRSLNQMLTTEGVSNLQEEFQETYMRYASNFPPPLITDRVSYATNFQAQRETNQ